MGVEIRDMSSPKKRKLSKIGIIVICAAVVIAFAAVNGILSSKKRNAPILEEVERCVTVTQNYMSANNIHDEKIDDAVKQIENAGNIADKAKAAQEMIAYAVTLFEGKPEAQDEITGAGNRLFVEMKKAKK